MVQWAKKWSCSSRIIISSVYEAECVHIYKKSGCLYRSFFYNHFMGFRLYICEENIYGGDEDAKKNFQNYGNKRCMSFMFLLVNPIDRLHLYISRWLLMEVALQSKRNLFFLPNPAADGWLHFRFFSSLCKNSWIATTLITYTYIKEYSAIFHIPIYQWNIFPGNQFPVILCVSSLSFFLRFC